MNHDLEYARFLCFATGRSLTRKLHELVEAVCSPAFRRNDRLPAKAGTRNTLQRCVQFPSKGRAKITRPGVWDWQQHAHASVSMAPRGCVFYGWAIGNKKSATARMPSHFESCYRPDRSVTLAFAVGSQTGRRTEASSVRTRMVLALPRHRDPTP